MILLVVNGFYFMDIFETHHIYHLKPKNVILQVILAIVCTRTHHPY
ncbi:hypothetical protein M975_1163 [Buttiauxella brennerae ATCC 51605]|uniref:Uncharacterized protein n=1 Tax=Buttiauxella brennerae ATCC 51605 TaxID=1354251 RepID=A0A1B7ISF5_9ENTR|nr:hypothetical protein M975_1163 [Buttiauxella brennerae ATCC 51605]